MAGAFLEVIVVQNRLFFPNLFSAGIITDLVASL